MFDGKYFSKLVKKNGFTSKSLSEKLALFGIKIGKDSIDGYRKNSVKTPNLLVLDKTASLFGVTLIDFMEDRRETRARIVNEELKNNPEEYLHLIPNALPPILKHIPITKGYPTLANKTIEEQSVHYVNKIYIDKRMIAKHYQEEELEGMVVVGDSMSPYLNHGDVAIYCPQKEPKGSAKYVINTPHGLEVKSLTFLTTGDLSMKTENPAFEDELIKKEDVDTIEILGLVVGRILKS